MLLLNLISVVAGARFHSGFIRVGGISCDIPLYLIDYLSGCIVDFPLKLSEIHGLLTGNRI